MVAELIYQEEKIREQGRSAWRIRKELYQNIGRQGQKLTSSDEIG
jgi:hypothetical protein